MLWNRQIQEWKAEIIQFYSDLFKQICTCKILEYNIYTDVMVQFFCCCYYVKHLSKFVKKINIAHLWSVQI